jgi:hypothetical protein
MRSRAAQTRYAFQQDVIPQKRFHRRTSESKTIASALLRTNKLLLLTQAGESG